MPNYSGIRFTAQLPPTPVTPEMREKVIDYAQKNGLSLSEIQRRALSLFFGCDDSKTIETDRLSGSRLLEKG
jgi:hypothetical protein